MMNTRAPLTKLAVILAFIFFLPLETAAQEKKGPPPWAPAHGYRSKTRHIYFPDHNFYFDLQKGVYIYISGTNWKVGVKLPSLFANIDLNGAVKVELELSTDKPQRHNADHKVKYKPKGKKYKRKKSGNSGKRKKKGN